MARVWWVLICLLFATLLLWDHRIYDWLHYLFHKLISAVATMWRWLQDTDNKAAAAATPAPAAADAHAPITSTTKSSIQQIAAKKVSAKAKIKDNSLLLSPPLTSRAILKRENIAYAQRWSCAHCYKHLTPGYRVEEMTNSTNGQSTFVAVCSETCI